jgi:hypothetical protein
VTGTEWDPTDWGPDDRGSQGAAYPPAGAAAGSPEPGAAGARAAIPGVTTPRPAIDYVSGRERRRRRRVATAGAAVLAIAIVAAVLAAVVHNSGAPKPASAQLTAAQAVAQAARQQDSVKSETTTITEQISGDVSGTITGTVQLQRAPLLLGMNLAESIAGHTVRIRAIITDSLMYLKLGSLPGVPRYLAAKWIRIPLTGLGQSSVFGTLQQQLQNDNPTSQLALLKGAGHLRAAGSQIVSGVSTTRYNGSITPSAAVKLLPAAQRAVLAPYLQQLRGNEAVSVWIDRDHNVRKIEVVENTAATTVVVEGTYSSFNQPVKIALPRPSQVYAPPASALDA